MNLFELYDRIAFLLWVGLGPGFVSERMDRANAIAQTVAEIWNRDAANIVPMSVGQTQQYWVGPDAHLNGNRQDYLGLNVVVCRRCGRISFQARFGNRVVDPDLPARLIPAFLCGLLEAKPSPYRKPHYH